MGVMELAMCRSFRSEDWAIDLKSDSIFNNCMLETLRLGKQKDRFSCGFYVLSSLCSFAATIENRPAFFEHEI